MRVHRLTLAALVALAAVGGLSIEATPSLAHLAYTAGPTAQFGEPCAAAPCGDGQFKEAAGVAVNDATHDVYVVDIGDDRVEELDAQGKYLTQFNGSGTLPGEGKAAGSGGLPNEKPTGRFAAPSSIAVDNSGGPASEDVYVADVGNNVLDVYNASGKYLSQITGAWGSGLPIGLAVDADGNLYVYVSEHSEGFVYEFDSAGNLLGKFDTERGPLKNAFGVDANGDVYLLYESEKAGKYTPEGKKLLEWDSGAVALAVDADTGNVFIGKESAIEEFAPYAEPDTEAIATFGVEGLHGSLALAVDASSGTVYATEPEGKIEVFQLMLFADASSGAASGIGPATATVSGSVKRDGLPTKYHFQYGETTAYGAKTAVVDVVGEEEDVSASLSDLFAASTYHYRLVAENENGASYGEDQTFTTAPALATVNDPPPATSDVTRTAALVLGTVNDEHSPTEYHIEYVAAERYAPGTLNPYAAGASSEVVTVEPSHQDQAVRPVPLSGLLAGTTYDYRLVATNGAGSAYGPDYTFTTAAATPPLVMTGAPSEVTQTGVLLSGTVATEELQTSYEFEVGLDTSYGGAKLFGNAGNSGTEAVSAGLQYLIPGTSYHYRLVATNEDGTTYGQDMTFTTPGVPSPIVQPPNSVFVANPTVVFPSVAGAITKAQGSRKRSKKKAKSRKKKGGGRTGKSRGRRGSVKERRRKG